MGGLRSGGLKDGGEGHPNWTHALEWGLEGSSVFVGAGGEAGGRGQGQSVKGLGQAKPQGGPEAVGIKVQAAWFAFSFSMS